jgi:uncharacterized protein (TIGR03435 family)
MMRRTIIAMDYQGRGPWEYGVRYFRAAGTFTRYHCILFLILIPHAQVRAQVDTPPPPPRAFDVTSVRQTDPSTTGMVLQPNPNSFIMKGVTLKFLITYAYGLFDFQVSGGPGWLDRDRYDIVAKTDATPSQIMSSRKRVSDEQGTDDQLVRDRLQSLLAERFKLNTHRETREMPILALTIERNGPRLSSSKEDTGFSVGSGELLCSHTSMGQLAYLLSGAFGHIVVDKTGLNGAYAFSLHWAPTDKQTDNALLPGLLTAIREQLGLSLKSERGPVPIVIIDQVERPSAN